MVAVSHGSKLACSFPRAGTEGLLARTEVSRGSAPHRAALLRTSCSAPRLLGVFPEEEAAFLAQMQTAVCSLQPAVTHAGTRKLLLCLDALPPNPNLGKAALSSPSTRLWVAGALDGWGTEDVQRVQGPEQRGNSGRGIMFSAWQGSCGHLDEGAVIQTSGPWPVCSFGVRS